jgi:hypothetical protein
VIRSHYFKGKYKINLSREANFETFAKRPLLSPPKNSGGSGLNFNPQNTQCIPVVNPPKFGGGSPSLALNKIGHFSKVSFYSRFQLTMKSLMFNASKERSEWDV